MEYCYKFWPRTIKPFSKHIPVIITHFLAHAIFQNYHECVPTFDCYYITALLYYHLSTVLICTLTIHRIKILHLILCPPKTAVRTVRASPVVSETEKLAADPLNSRVEPQWIGLVQAHATDAWSNWDLGNFPGWVKALGFLSCYSSHSSVKGPYCWKALFPRDGGMLVCCSYVR